MDSDHSVSTCVQVTLHQPSVAELDNGSHGESNPGFPRVDLMSDHRAMRRFSSSWQIARFELQPGPQSAHAERGTRVTSMGGLYDTATLHAQIGKN